MARPRKRSGTGMPRVMTNSILMFKCIVCQRKYIYNRGGHSECVKKGCYQRYCSYCSIAFSSSDALKQHAKEFHAKTYCTKCDEVFESNLKEHVKEYHFTAPKRKTSK